MSPERAEPDNANNASSGGGNAEKTTIAEDPGPNQDLYAHRIGGSNAAKAASSPGGKGEKMGEIWPKQCEGGRDRRDHLDRCLDCGDVCRVASRGRTPAARAALEKLLDHPWVCVVDEGRVP